MKRTGPPLRRTPLAPGKPPKRTKRLRQRGAKAAAKHAAQFGEKAEWIRTLPCTACGASGPCHAHHVKTRGAGGTAKDLAPLCAACHDRLHRVGRLTFETFADVDLTAEAARLDRHWAESRAAPPRSPG